MENNKDILPYILQYLQKDETEQITVVDDSFVVQLSEHNAHGFWKRGARLVGIVLTALTVVLFLVYSIVFYCQNVLFYRGELNINQFGAFTPSKSYSSEYAMYLFDTNEKWISSGIQVRQGDLLFIAASGAFHSNYEELVDAAQNNTLANTEKIKEDGKTARLRWIFYPKTETSKGNVVNAPFIKVTNPGSDSFAYFGDVLFQVVPEKQISNLNYVDTARVYKVPYAKYSKTRRPVEMQQDGVLAFMVNDSNIVNNVGQILVVMEIFRAADGYNWSWLTVKKMAYRWLDIPYYYYELHRHMGLPVCAFVAYVLLAILTLAFFCLFMYYMPIGIYYFTYLIIKGFGYLKRKIVCPISKTPA